MKKKVKKGHSARIKVLITNSDINGYHKFPIRPNKDIKMLVKLESYNQYDPMILMPWKLN